MFACERNKAFLITFRNGYTVNCRFGSADYCKRCGTHMAYGHKLGEEQRMPFVRSDDCQVEVWNKAHMLVTGAVLEMAGIDYEKVVLDVWPYATPDEVAKLIAFVVALDGNEL